MTGLSYERPMPCKWVFRIKYNSNKKIKKDKARFVAKDSIHLKEIGHMDTFSPVVKLTTVILLLPLAFIHN